MVRSDDGTPTRRLRDSAHFLAPRRRGALDATPRQAYVDAGAERSANRMPARRRRITPAITLLCAVAAQPAAHAQHASAESAATQPASAPVGQSPSPTDDATTAQPIPAASAASHRRALTFEDLSLDLGFDAEWRRRRTNIRGNFFEPRYRQTDESRRFEETVGLRGSGDLIDEKFLRYEFDVRGGLTQEAYGQSRIGPDLTEHPHGDVFEYDARATIFPAGKMTGNFFASNTTSRVPRPFLPSLDRRHERYGAEVLYNDAVLPMRLTFEHDFEELASFARWDEDDERRGDDRLRYEATYQPSDAHQLRLEYEYGDRSEQYSGTPARFDTTRNYLSLNDTLLFGDDKRSRLDTIARYQQESGDLARDILEFTPQLRLQHTDSLSTTYRGQFLSESYDGIEADTYRGDFSVHNRFSDWFDAGLNLYGLAEQVEQGSDQTEFGGGASASVQKELESGRFSANLNYTHSWLRTDNPGGQGVVFSEAATFRDPLPVVLNHTDIWPFSILVTDASRARVFLPGRDYTISQAGRYTALHRVRTGNILDGQTVLVSYTYRVAQGQEANRDRVDLRIQHAFKTGWTPYYALSLQDERIDRDRFAYYEPRDVNRHRLGVDYRQKRWSVGGELEYNDDSIDPYMAAHARGDATLYERDPHSLATRANYSYFSFDGARDFDSHDASLLDIGLDYRFQAINGVELAAAAAYRYEDDTLYGVTHGVDLSASVGWRIGMFTLLIEAEYDHLRLPGSNDNSVSLWVKIRRDIPIVGRREP